MMATEVTATERLTLRQYIGPWPLRPLVAMLLTGMYTAAYSIGYASGAGSPARLSVISQIVIQSLIPALALFVILEFSRRFIPAVRSRLWVYLLVAGTATTTVFCLRLLLGALEVSEVAENVFGVLFVIVRNFVLLLVLQSTIGVASWRLNQQIERTDQALTIAREQQAQLLNADERTRQQVSSLLHDKVQAGLIAACLELQEAVDDGGNSKTITQVIDRLEDLRALDVRRAARNLSPDLADTDLQAALEELGAQYGPGMRVAVRVDQALLRTDRQLSQVVLLGCYRIIEQAVLNSAVHGRATECDVDVKCSTNALTLEVRDNGIGLGSQPSITGIGSTLTTTWARVLNGEWTRTPQSHGGVVLRASIPL